MKGYVITQKGIEGIAALEVKELLHCAAKLHDRIIVFDANPEDLALLCYRMQGASYIGLLLTSFTSKNIVEELEKKVKSIEIPFIKKDTKLGVECLRVGNHAFTSQDATSIIGKALRERGLVVDYKHADLTLFCFINDDDCYVGIDFCGIDLSKRRYKMFSSQQSLKGTIAYALVRKAGVQHQHLVIDPFAKSGEIIIEAALYLAKRSPWYYTKEEFALSKLPVTPALDVDALFSEWDKQYSEDRFQLYGYDSLMKHIVAATKNAKLAGIHKQLKFSRVAIDWVDLKMDEASVDRMVTLLPAHSKRAEVSVVRKLYDHFFNQGAYMLKDDGLIVVACLTDALLLEIAQHYHLILKERTLFWQGEQKIHVLVLGKT